VASRQDYGSFVAMRVLTWNLFHGRSVPDRPGSLLDEFSRALAGWRWDVALLQEVPPWWPPELGRAAGASARMALTSRNLLLPLRRLIAERNPALLGSWGGGSNAILVRGQAIGEHRVRPLRLLPERRVVHGVRLADGTWVSNLHGQVRAAALARADLDLAARTTLAWAAGSPAVLGGDLNLRGEPGAGGFEHAAGHFVDHILVRALHPAGPGHTLDRGGLSDHAPLWVDVQPA
jgi:endonuclease/exonuclease/phosphatase family metal-dependent hydrolase